MSALSPENHPIDLWNTIGPPGLPLGLLPKIVEDFSLVVARRIGASPSGLAMAALTVIGAAIPDHVKVQPKKFDRYWQESARIWTVLVGDPSSKKSPIISAAVSPLAQMDESLFRAWLEEHNAWSALPKEEKVKVPEPKARRLRIEDTTVEAAQEVLKGSPDGILCVQDELSGWFGAMEKYTSARGAGADRAFWLRAFNGGSYALDRVGRGSTVLANNSISLLGGIQPEPIRKIAASAVDDGLLQRMFPIILDYVGVGMDTEKPPVQEIYNFTVMMINHVTTFGIPLRFDEDAQLLRRQLEEKHVRLMSTEIISKKFGSHIGKYDGLFARLCVIWHAIENCNQKPLPNLITYETAERVAKFMERFLFPHAACFYQSLGLSNDFDRVKAVAEQILVHRLDKVTVRDVQRGTRAMRGLTPPEALPVLQQLVAFNWVAEHPGPRLSSDPIFIVNPEVHRLYAERGEREKKRRKEVHEIMQECFTQKRSNL